jgi:hypothetical protein
MNRFLLLFCFSSVLSTSAMAAEDRPYYMWVDDEGVVNISQVQPPSDVRAREVFDEKKRAEFEATGRPGRVEPDEENGEDDSSPSELPEVAVDLPWNQDLLGNQTVDEISQEARDLNCALGRQVLRRLNAHPHIFMKDTQGFWRKLSPERLAQEKQKAQQTINSNCRPE